MSQRTKQHRHINWRHLILGIILNILVIIAALIIYHLTFNTSKNSSLIPTPQNLINQSPNN